MPVVLVGNYAGGACWQLVRAAKICCHFSFRQDLFYDLFKIILIKGACQRQVQAHGK